MGMTIEEAISWLVSITEHEGEDIPIYDDDVKAIAMAIDTMRKYQKIEDIYYHQTGRALEDSLRSVIEDGKID